MHICFSPIKSLWKVKSGVLINTLFSGARVKPASSQFRKNAQIFARRICPMMTSCFWTRAPFCTCGWADLPRSPRLSSGSKQRPFIYNIWKPRGSPAGNWPQFERETKNQTLLSASTAGPHGKTDFIIFCWHVFYHIISFPRLKIRHFSLFTYNILRILTRYNSAWGLYRLYVLESFVNRIKIRPLEALSGWFHLQDILDHIAYIIPCAVSPCQNLEDVENKQWTMSNFYAQKWMSTVAALFCT